VKINRLELIEILEERISKSQTERQRRYEKAVQEYEAAEAEYFNRTRDAWMAFATTITEKIVKKEIIRQSDIPRALAHSWSSINVFEKTRPVAPVAESEFEAHLRALINVLNKTTDKEISTYSLEKMGFPLRRVLK